MDAAGITIDAAAGRGPVSEDKGTHGEEVEVPSCSRT